MRWNAKNPERVRAANRAHHERNPGRWRRYHASTRERRRYWKAWVIIEAGGACVRCGFADPRALQLDHVNGNGSAERKTGSIRSISHTKSEFSARRLLARVHDGALQLLCANCNWIKREERGEYVQGHDGYGNPFTPR